jgi:DNA-binding transcriptional LysR family regulator
MFDAPLPHLATFVQAAELASFTAAARVLGITQAAVSQRVQMLEGVLRVGLFQRCSGRVALTNAGRRLYEYARRIADLHAEARTAVADSKPDPIGELALAASSIPGKYILPNILTAYRRAHPHVDVRVRISDSDDVLRLVEQGEVDFGFAGDSVDSRHLIFDRLAGDELALVVPVGHHFAKRRRVGLRDLVREPLIQREKGSGSRHCLERALCQVGQDLRALKFVLEVDGNEAIKEAIVQGQGLAVLSRRSVQCEVMGGTIRALPIAGLKLARDLFVVRDRRRPLSTPAQVFLSQLQSVTVSAS